jgi:hypothetical protein
MGYGNEIDIEQIVGLTVSAYTISPDRQTFVIDGSKDGVRMRATFEAYGDCCSQTWIEGVYEENALVGHTIAKVEDLELTAALNGNDHTALVGTDSDTFYEEEMQFYGIAITTERGVFKIDFRNSSNGYYGGSLDFKTFEPVDSESVTA